GRGHAGGQDGLVARAGGRDADDHAGDRDDAVVGPAHRGAQPAGAVAAVESGVAAGHACSPAGTGYILERSRARWRNANQPRPRGAYSSWRISGALAGSRSVSPSSTRRPVSTSVAERAA